MQELEPVLQTSPEIIEVSPEDFDAYQQRIAEIGCATIQMIRYYFDEVKVETQRAVLIKRGSQVAWIPKSCIYNLENATEHDIGSVYVVSTFAVDWSEDNQ